MRPYIEWLRTTDHDKTLYSDFEFLAVKIRKYEQKAVGAATQPSRDELVNLLEEEAGLILRPATLRDVPQLVEIENDSFIEADAYAAQEFQDLMRKYRGGITIAELCGQVAGYVLSYDSNRAGEIDSMAVSPQFRRLGLANRLLRHAIARGRQHAVKAITLEVRPENHEAISLYRSLRFQQMPEPLENYYDDGGSAYRMVLDLSTESTAEVGKEVADRRDWPGSKTAVPPAAQPR
jgi:ribosomal-protein-alanine N-acetyltransferase